MRTPRHRRLRLPALRPERNVFFEMHTFGKTMDSGIIPAAIPIRVFGTAALIRIVPKPLVGARAGIIFQARPPAQGLRIPASHARWEAFQQPPVSAVLQVVQLSTGMPRMSVKTVRRCLETHRQMSARPYRLMQRQRPERNVLCEMPGGGTARAGGRTAAVIQVRVIGIPLRMIIRIVQRHTVVATAGFIFPVPVLVPDSPALANRVPPGCINTGPAPESCWSMEHIPKDTIPEHHAIA